MRMAGATPLKRLTRRPEFLNVARGRKAVAPGLVLQAKINSNIPDDEIRVGYTASKKVGNAVQRNRARRRLKAAASDVLKSNAKNGADYVIIARAATLDRPYDDLLDDLRHSLKRVWQDKASKGNRRRKEEKR